MIQWIYDIIISIYLGHLELTRDRFLHDSLRKRWVRVKLDQIMTPILKIDKSMVDFAQLVLIVIKALFSQSLK